MSRRTLSLLLVLLVGLLPAGCWSRTEVNDLAIVSMMAIDKTEDGRLQIWLQVVVPSHAGGAAGVPGGRGKGPPFITVSGTGKTILEAARFIQIRLSRRIFWAHARVILIGERLARAGVRPAMDFLMRHRELRLDNYILVVQGSVAELMGTELDLERQPVEALREILLLRTGTMITLGDWVRRRAAPGADPFMGIAQVIYPPKGAPREQHPRIQVGGTALFRGDRLVGTMNTHVTRGLLWLLGEVYMGVITLELPRAPGGAISLEYVASRVYRRVRIENGKVVLTVKVHASGTISDEQVNLDLANPAIIKAIEVQMQAEIKERIDAAIREMRQLQVDSVGMGELVRQRHPATWKRLAKYWRTEAFQAARIVVQVDAKVRRTGLSNQPRGIPEEELIKGAP